MDDIMNGLEDLAQTVSNVSNKKKIQFGGSIEDFLGIIHDEHQAGTRAARMESIFAADKKYKNFLRGLAHIAINEDKEYFLEACDILERYAPFQDITEEMTSMLIKDYKPILETLAEDKVFEFISSGNELKKLQTLAIGDKDLILQASELCKKYKNLERVFSQITNDKSLYARIVNVVKKNNVVDALLKARNIANIENLVRIFEVYEDYAEIFSRAVCEYTGDDKFYREQRNFFVRNRTGEIINLYENKEVIIRALNLIIIKNVREEGAHVSAQYLKDERVIKDIHEHPSKAVYYASMFSIPFFDIHDKYILDLVDRRPDFLYFTQMNTRGHIGDIARIYDKYIDMFENLADMFEGDYLHELTKDECYEHIVNSRNPAESFKEIMSTDYGTMKQKITEDFTYRDLRIVKETWNLVKNIHSKRDDKHIKEIEDGFYSELNRAVAQGDKNRMLKIYCNEVKNQIRQNGKDLMVVTHG